MNRRQGGTMTQRNEQAQEGDAASTSHSWNAPRRAQQELLDELGAFRPDVDLLPENPTAQSLTFAQTFGGYLAGDCSLQAAREAWEGYVAEVGAKPRGPLEYRRSPVPPEMLAQYALMLTSETAPLDDFTQRVLDLCLLAGYLRYTFLRNVEMQGPVAAVYERLHASGMDEETALGALLHDKSVHPLRLFSDPAALSPAPGAAPNALGRFLLTLLPDRLDLLTRLLSRPNKVPQDFSRNLPLLMTLLGTYPDDLRYLPLAWRVARQAPPLLVGACAHSLLGSDPAGFDDDLQAQTGLTVGTRDERLAVCRVLLGAERDAMDDLLRMRTLLRQPDGTHPMDDALPIWLGQSSPLVWWAPLFSAMADERVLPRLGKGVSFKFWRELGKSARQRGMLVESEPGGPRWPLSRSTYLKACEWRVQHVFAQAGMHLDLSASELREALMPHLGPLHSTRS
jgi:hypothetical protein